MWKKQESNLRPSDCELVDGNYWVRKNIKEVTRKDEMSGVEITLFEYEENILNDQEYSQYQEILKNAGDVAYLSMMTGIDLPDEEE